MPPDALVHSVLETRFAAMGGVVHAIDCSEDNTLLARVHALFARYECTLSRFRPDSELCALNNGGGAQFAASPVLFDAVTEALRWSRRTGGVFDPTIIDALESAGYDRTFEEVVADGPALCARPRSDDWTGVTLGTGRTIALARGARLDLGGIGKGFTVDRAIGLLGPHANAMVNASGDLFAAGPGPEGAGWAVDIDDPVAPGRDLARLRLRDRGVATSSSAKRRWRRAGDSVHHLIDARTGLSGNTGVLQVTVVAPTATAADVLAKFIFLAGEQASRALLEEHDAEALVIRLDGSLSASPGLGGYLA